MPSQSPHVAHQRHLCLLFAALLSASACSKPPPEHIVEAPRVITSPVVAVDLEHRIEVTGELQASLHTVVSAEVGGTITQVTADTGQAVEKGQILLEIDPQRRRLELETAQARVSQAEASQTQQRRQTERVRSLQRQGVTSSSQLDEADLQLQLATSRLSSERAMLALAKKALDDATVRAPFAGVAGTRHVNLAAFVQVGTPLIELVALDPLEVVFHVAEIDSAVIRKGQRVDVRVAPYPSESFPATVDVISPTMESASRTLRVKATLPNPKARLRPGLFARADLGVSLRQGVVMVSDEAVLQRADGAVVFRVVDGPRVERRAVELGTFHDHLVEVRSGLTPGDVVVTRGHMDLVDGMVVQVVEGEDKPRNIAAETGVMQ